MKSRVRSDTPGSCVQYMGAIQVVHLNCHGNQALARFYRLNICYFQNFKAICFVS